MKAGAFQPLLVVLRSPGLLSPASCRPHLLPTGRSYGHMRCAALLLGLVSFVNTSYCLAAAVLAVSLRCSFAGPAHCAVELSATEVAGAL